MESLYRYICAMERSIEPSNTSHFGSKPVAMATVRVTDSDPGKSESGPVSSVNNQSFPAIPTPVADDSYQRYCKTPMDDVKAAKTHGASPGVSVGELGKTPSTEAVAFSSERPAIVEDGLDAYQRLCKTHMDGSKTVKAEVVAHPCQICLKVFSSWSRLRRHLQIHANFRPHMCKTCARSFHNPSKLRRHEMTHSKAKPYSCNMCDVKVSRPEHLRRHLLTHSESRPFKCSVCNYTGRRTDSIKAHIRKKHGGGADIIEAELDFSEDLPPDADGGPGQEEPSDKPIDPPLPPPTTYQQAKVEPGLETTSSCCKTAETLPLPSAFQIAKTEPSLMTQSPCHRNNNLMYPPLGPPSFESGLYPMDMGQMKPVYPLHLNPICPPPVLDESLAAKPSKRKSRIPQKADYDNDKVIPGPNLHMQQ